MLECAIRPLGLTHPSCGFSMMHPQTHTHTHTHTHNENRETRTKLEKR